MKRVFCLLLTIFILTSSLPTTAFAGTSFGAGTGPSQGGGGSGTDTAWTPDTKSAGILVNVQKTPTTISGPLDEQGRPKGYTDTLKYWCTHFPSTYPEDGVDGIYLIPGSARTRLSGSQPAAGKWHQFSAHNNNVFGHENLGYHGAYMKHNANNNRVTNWRGRDAYALAASRRTQSNPSFSLPSNYWENLIETLRSVPGEEEGCFNIIAELFSPNDITYGFVTTEAVSQVNDQVMDYLGQVPGSDNDPEVYFAGISKDDYDVALFLYYCGFIATAITALPDKAARTPLSRDLDNMCQNYLNGQPYNPMVVTAEIIVSTEYYGSNKTADVWWTPAQAIRAVTKNDGKIEDISGYIANYPNLKPIDAIGASMGKVFKSAPARTMFGINYPGEGFKKYGSLAVRGRVIQSIDPSYLTGLGLKPIEGFGVWGVTSALTPPQQVIPPPSDAELTPMGEVSIDVMEKVYVEDSLSFAETLDLTVKVSLDASYIETEGDVVVNEGAGIVPCLGWLKEHDTTGSYMPEIRIFVKQAEPITALDSNKAEELIQRTWGYYGSGLAPFPNDNGEVVTPEPTEENRAYNKCWGQAM